MLLGANGRCSNQIVESGLHQHEAAMLHFKILSILHRLPGADVIVLFFRFSVSEENQG
jgi:hypothetical protein